MVHCLHPYFSSFPWTFNLRSSNEMHTNLNTLLFRIFHYFIIYYRPLKHKGKRVRKVGILPPLKRKQVRLCVLLKYIEVKYGQNINDFKEQVLKLSKSSETSKLTLSPFSRIVLLLAGIEIRCKTTHSDMAYQQYFISEANLPLCIQQLQSYILLL